MRIGLLARGGAQQIGEFFLPWHDPNGVGRDHKEIMRIVGRFRLQR
jgi:hypothetical protein